MEKCPVFFPSFYIQNEIFRLALLAQDDQIVSERPSSAGFAATFPQGGRQGSTHTVLMYAPARPAARGGNKLSIAPNNIQKRRNRILPFFPYEHTDGGECAARFNKREPLYARRRGEKPPPARRVILRDERMAGFPLPLDNFFRQLERNCENHYRESPRTQSNGGDMVCRGCGFG